jgi:hypothetical protein
MESPADRNRMDGRRLETSRVDASPYFDPFHYLVQANSELRRPRKRSIMDGVRLRGRVGKAVVPYADGADIPARENRRYLQEYLLFSAANLNLETPRRGSRVRSKLYRGFERSR